MGQGLQRFYKRILPILIGFLVATQSFTSIAASAEDLNQDSAHALQSLYKVNPTAALIAKNAKAILVFPKVVKAGLVFGGSNSDTNHAMEAEGWRRFLRVCASMAYRTNPSRAITPWMSSQAVNVYQSAAIYLSPWLGAR